MVIVILCSSFIIIVILIIKLYIEIKKNKLLDDKCSKYSCELMIKELRDKNVKELSLVYSSNINKLNKLVNQKQTNKNKEQIEYLNRIIKEDYNNLNVIINSYTNLFKQKNNIINELNLLKKDIEKNYTNIKINLKFDKKVSDEYIYDNLKLISTLRLILSKTIENNGPKEITISLKANNLSRKKSRLCISVDNVILEDNVIQYLSEEHIELFNTSYYLPVIKQNIISLNGRLSYLISYENETKKNVMQIDFEVENVIKKIRALVVDDMIELAEINKEVLNNIGIDADVVYNGKDCLELIKKNTDKYDIIFTDNQMPQLCGTELIGKLRNIKNFDIPVIIVTSDSGEEYNFLEHYKFDGYIVKPLTEDKAKEVIEKLEI